MRCGAGLGAGVAAGRDVRRLLGLLVQSADRGYVGIVLDSARERHLLWFFLVQWSSVGGGWWVPPGLECVCGY